MNIIGAHATTPWYGTSGDAPEVAHEPSPLALAQGYTQARRSPDCGTPEQPVCMYYAECLRRVIRLQPFVDPDCEAALKLLEFAEVPPHPPRYVAAHRLVLAALVGVHTITAPELAERAGICANTARDHLNVMCREGTAKRHGYQYGPNRKSVVYKIIADCE